MLGIGHFVEGFSQSREIKFSVTNKPPQVYEHKAFNKDIDSLAIISDDFVFHDATDLSIYPAPDYKWSYHSDTGVNYSNEDLDLKNVPIHKITNFELAMCGRIMVN